MYTTYSIDSTSLEGLEGFDFASIMAAIGAFIAAYSIFAILISIFMIIVMWKLFQKAGKPGWAILVPIYNTVVLFQIAGINPWLLLLSILPVVGWAAIGIICIVANFKIAKAFGKDIGYGFGLWFLGIIFYPILAFGDAQYVGVDDNKEKVVEEVKPEEPKTE